MFTNSYRLTALFLCFLLVGLSGSASTEECSLNSQQAAYSFDSLLAAIGFEVPDAPEYPSGVQIPLAFHILARTDGTGGLDAGQVSATLQNLNSRYAQIGVSFFSEGAWDTIRNGTLYANGVNSDDRDSLEVNHNAPSRVNIYFV